MYQIDKFQIILLPGISEITNVPDSIKVEHVEVIVDIDHSYRGDLEIILTSPSGTQSVLSEKARR